METRIIYVGVSIIKAKKGIIRFSFRASEQPTFIKRKHIRITTIFCSFMRISFKFRMLSFYKLDSKWSAWDGDSIFLSSKSPCNECEHLSLVIATYYGLSYAQLETILLHNNLSMSHIIGVRYCLHSFWKCNIKLLTLWWNITQK